jgi:hypothetical protein
MIIPRDFPDRFVARMWIVINGAMIPTRSIMTSRRLDDIRSVLNRAGLVCISRYTNDDPNIIETWQ